MENDAAERDRVAERIREEKEDLTERRI